MHEIGHNIGLHHSGEYSGTEKVKEYGDMTGMMGFGHIGDDTPAMCFNPAKSWQVGWYADKQIELNVNADLSCEGASIILNGVVDYQDNSVDRYIVVKIGNFYIGYNRAVSFNAGVMEAPDQVTIVEKLGGPEESTTSKLASKLSVGGFYTFQVTDTVEVTAMYVSNFNEKDAVVEFKSNGACPNAEIQVVVTTDNNTSEISWEIYIYDDYLWQSIYSAERDGLTSIETYTDVVGLFRGLQYYFVIWNTGGDETGSYRVTFEGEEIFSSSGGEFVTIGYWEFSLPPLQPTSAPTSTEGPSAVPTSNSTSTSNEGPTPGPTSTPTSFPTRGPTSTPTESPTEGPTSAPTSKPTIDCMDNPTKKFDIEVNGTIRKKDCSWVASKNKPKRKEYCKTKVEVKNGNTRKISDICKETCGLVGKGSCKHLKL
jgi:hypothetical protein